MQLLHKVIQILNDTWPSKFWGIDLWCISHILSNYSFCQALLVKIWFKIMIASQKSRLFDISSRLHFWCIRYPLILRINILSFQHHLEQIFVEAWFEKYVQERIRKKLYKVELYGTKKERRKWIFSKCRRLWIIDVVLFTLIKRTLNKRLHRHTRMLKLCALI